MRTHKVLLAGATGYLGKYIAQKLKEKEYDTTLIVRNKSSVAFSDKHYKIIEAQVTQPLSLVHTMDNVDVLISTVGITRQKDRLTYMDVDYQANMNLLKEAKMAGVKKFIYVSALHGDKLRHLKIGEAKEKFVDQLENSGLDYCILRPNGFFSDMTEFLKMAKKGTVNLFGDGTFKMNPIHGEDLATVCVDAIQSSVKEINVGGPDVYTHNEIADLAFEVMDKKPKIKYMPEGMRKLVLWMTRTFTSSKTYGPMEFFFTVLAMDMIAPTYGNYSLKRFYEEVKGEI